MKLKLAAAACLVSLTSLAHADAGFFAGITYVFGERDGLGFTVKALATRRDDRPAAALGLSVYPGAGGARYGVDVGVGYQGNDAAGLISYDLLLNQFALSVGYADMKDD